MTMPMPTDIGIIDLMLAIPNQGKSNYLRLHQAVIDG